MRSRTYLGHLVVASSLVATTLAFGSPTQASTPPPPAAAPAAGAAVGKPLGNGAVGIARAHLARHATEFGLSRGDVKALTVSSVVPSANNGLTSVYFQQRLNGLVITEALLNVAVRADGSVMRVASNAVASAAKVANDATPGISDVAAAKAAASALKLKPTSSFGSDDLASGADRERLLGDGGISSAAIPAHLVYQRTAKGDLRLAWELGIDELSGQHWWQIRMDADSGDALAANDWVSADSHNVFPVPVEAPSFATPVDTRTIVSNPATGASPFGWNDTNGVAGAESTLTIGNNVSAYTDTNNDNAPDAGSQPDGGAGLAFNFPLDLTQPPSGYRPAAVSNLYFTVNRIHDITYRYGFNEAAGNFQVNNYGHGGAGADAVLGEAQDGGGTNNANFATPPDGASGRMQMYVWTGGAPNRDGDLDNGVIIHEYGHGVSNRLTGGPANVSCLGNTEQAGEGWSDYLAYMLTMPNGTEPAGGRGIGTYVLFQPTTGVGIRTQKYSTNTGVNNETYDTIKTAVAPHGVGEVWAEMLWEMTYALIGQYGFDGDLLNGTAGNNKSLQLVLDGMKLQPCSPGFVDGRDAILAADQADYAGANQCLIWTAFAKRGLGFSASQGSSASKTDGTQAFDLPPTCLGVTVTRTATPSPVPAGQQLTYGFHVVNSKSPAATVTGVSVTGAVGLHATYVPGSATCAGTYEPVSKVVTFPIGSLAASAAVDCQFKVLIDASPSTVVRFDDDLEPDASAWSATHGTGLALDWALTTTAPHSATHAVFASDPSNVSDQYLTLNVPVAVATGDTLSFWHSRALESTFDGGVVEVSTDGGATWSDIGDANWLSNGYNATISSGFSSPIAGRKAFSGASPFIQSVANLTPWAGQAIKIRFRMASDTSIAATGWTVDDVNISNLVETVSAGTAAATGVPIQNNTVSTTITAAAPTAPEAPTVTATTPTNNTATTAFTPGFNGGSPVTSYGVECVSTDGGVTGSATGAGSPLAVGALTGGKSYHCHVKATNAVGSSAYGAFGPTVVVPPIVVPPTPHKPGKPKVKKSTPISSTVAKIKFTKPSNGGSPITKYQVSCKSKDGGTLRKAIGKKTKIKVKKLTPGTHYKCKVRAKNAVGWGKFGKSGKKFKMPQAANHRLVSLRSRTVAGRLQRTI